MEDKRQDDGMMVGKALTVQQDLSTLSESEKLIVSVLGAGNVNVLNFVAGSMNKCWHIHLIILESIMYISAPFW